MQYIKYFNNCSFRSNIEDKSIIGCSENIYKPIQIILGIGEIIEPINSEKNLYYKTNYKKYESEYIIYKSKNFNTFEEYFLGSVRVLQYTYGTNNFNYLIQQGFILDENYNILLALGVKTGNFYKRKNNVDFIDKDNFKIFISTKLAFGEKHKNFFKKFSKEILQKFIDVDIPIEYTTSEDIEDQLYGVEIDTNFRNIKEYEDLLEKVKNLEELNTELVTESSTSSSNDLDDLPF